MMGDVSVLHPAVQKCGRNVLDPRAAKLAFGLLSEPESLRWCEWAAEPNNDQVSAVNHDTLNLLNTKKCLIKPKLI